MPFGNVNGALEPLEAGVPVVTLLGKKHGERSAYTILANLGVTQTVAESGRDYVEIAARLADDPAFMREVRDAIRAGLAVSPLVDAVAHTRHLEAAYLAALRDRAPEVLAATGDG
jgi:predicted O-linked N-acetylglucosamine transferase (SPINDLY family)